MGKRYADVEYAGAIYLDAECIAGEWYYEDGWSGFYPFPCQHWVTPINELRPERRHPPERSGHVLHVRKIVDPGKAAALEG